MADNKTTTTGSKTTGERNGDTLLNNTIRTTIQNRITKLTTQYKLNTNALAINFGMMPNLSNGGVVWGWGCRITMLDGLVTLGFGFSATDIDYAVNHAFHEVESVLPTYVKSIAQGQQTRVA